MIKLGSTFKFCLVPNRKRSPYIARDFREVVEDMPTYNLSVAYVLQKLPHAVVGGTVVQECRSLKPFYFLIKL